jgi:hypothetical protein
MCRNVASGSMIATRLKSAAITTPTRITGPDASSSM